uniref:Phosphoglycolate phosphatase n=1 Tax=Oryza nivara TaxID=4536 RepID=A0A0E0FQ19_ORYNI
MLTPVVAAAAPAPARSRWPLEDAATLIDSVETFIFDCDGREADRRSARDARHARSKGKRLVFVTNNSTKSRKQYGKKFETLGLNVNEEEIFASSFAYVAYLQSIDFPKDKKVYVIGEDGILKELELAGFQYLGGPSDGDKKIELKPGFYMEHDKDVTTIPTSTRHLFHMSRMVVGDSVSTASSVCCATPVDLQSAKRRPMCTIFLYTLILDMAKSGVEFEAINLSSKSMNLHQLDSSDIVLSLQKARGLFGRFSILRKLRCSKIPSTWMVPRGSLASPYMLPLSLYLPISFVPWITFFRNKKSRSNAWGII